MLLANMFCFHIPKCIISIDTLKIIGTEMVIQMLFPLLASKVVLIPIGKYHLSTSGLKYFMQNNVFS